MTYRKLFLIVVILALCLLCNDNALSIIKTANLVGGWRFEGNANDFSGNSNNGTVTGAVLATGKFGQGYSFDGNGDYVLTILNVAGQTGLTAAGWFYQTSSAARETALGTYTSTTDMAFDIDLVANTRQIQFNILGEGGVRSDLDTATGVYSGSTWTHVAVTWNGSTMIIYVNGVNIASKAYSASSIEQTVTQKVIFGRYNEGVAAQQFSGSIDEVRVYNRALNASEIRSLMLGYEPGEF